MVAGQEVRTVCLTRVSMCSDTKDTGTTTRFFTPDAPSSIRVSSVYGLRESDMELLHTGSSEERRAAYASKLTIVRADLKNRVE